MKKFLQSFVLLLTALMVPMTVTAAYVQLADGVYQDGSTLYIGSDVTSLGSLRVNPSVIYCYATIPPSLMNNTFTGYNAEVHVPAAGMVAYFTALYWYNFNNITADAIEPQSVTLSETAVELETDGSVSLTATVAPSNATPSAVFWSSTNTAVATVNGGTVMAVATGECDIIASCATVQAVCHVVVTPQCVTVTLDKHEAHLLPNHTMTLNATCTPPTTDLAVTTSDPTVAIPRYVNGSIMVVGVGEGTATITVTTADGWAIPDSCEVTVYTLLGDVNYDGFVNVADVTMLISHILGSEPAGFNETKADVNHDGNLNVADVTTLIAYILGKIDLNPPTVPEIETFAVNGVSFTMVYVEGGTFMMGATIEQVEDASPVEKPAHQVTLSSFSIGETEVTQALWFAVMGDNPSSFSSRNDYIENLQRPVECVSWNDCQTFITKLNEMTGKAFRLPTEAEWEYAARGGNKSQGYKYAGSNSIDDVAWYRDNTSSQMSSPDYGTHTVGTKTYNELGLYDMSGNVNEWVQDWWSGSYNGEVQTNPMGPTTGSYRVYRGGSWGYYANNCRVSSRSSLTPTSSNGGIGLRLALDSDISPEPEEHEWADLGLPSGTLWATCNIGANSPEEYGDYFAWGETAPKDYYDISTYKWCNGSVFTMTKYCTTSEYGFEGFTDGKTELDLEDDAAYVNWGPSWRMPTIEQQEELIDNCTWTWTSRNGVNGLLVTGPNGNFIFLPAAGSCWLESLYNVGSYGDYWSRTLCPSDSDDGYYAYCLYFNSGSVYRYYYSYSTDGLPVRAVRVP